MLVPIQASAAAMASRGPACHTKQKAWRLENRYYVFARGQAVCDTRNRYAKEFDVEVKLPKVKFFKGFDNPAEE